MDNKGILSTGMPFPIQGLQHYWRFDEVSGTIAYDAWGGVNGVLVNGIERDFIKIGNGLKSTANNHFVTLMSNGNGIINLQQFSIGLWFKTGSNLINKVIWSYDRNTHSAPFYSQHIRTTSGGDLYFAYNRGGTFRGFNLYENLETNTLYHLVLTVTPNKICGYINGVLVEENTEYTGNITYYNQEVRLGGSPNLSTVDYNSNGWSFDEVGFWNRALIHDEVKALYSGGRGKALPFQPYMGLQSYWNFDEVSGSTAHDLVGGADGVIVGDATLNTAGKIDSGFKTNEADAAGLDLGNTPNLFNISNSFTFSTWLYYINHSSNDSFGEILALMTRQSGTASTNEGIAIGIGDDKLYLRKSTVNKVVVFFNHVRTASTIPKNQWLHVVVTNRDTNTFIYINGVSVTLENVGSGVPAGNVSFDTDSTNRNSIMTSWLNRNGPRFGLEGSIDELGIWNRVLTPQEVEQLYNEGAGKFYDIPAFGWGGLQHYWNFDEVEGTTAADSVGGNDGVASNARVIGEAGKKGNGADFTQGSDEIVLNNNLILGSNFTVSTWINIDNFTTASGYYHVFSKNDINTNNSFQLCMRDRLDAENRIYPMFRIYNSSSQSAVPYFGWDSNEFSFNTWYMLTYTQSNGVGQFYLNGQARTMTNGTGIPTPSTTAGTIKIGSSTLTFSTSHPLDGLVDELGVWNRVLTAKEVEQLYNEGNGKFY